MKLIEKKSIHQSYYELGFEFDCKVELPKLKPEWILDDDILKVSKVCISDAHTHIERLVFPAWYCKNVETGKRVLFHDMSDIAGSLTFLIHGGNVSTLKTPEEYAQEIKLKYKWRKQSE